MTVSAYADSIARMPHDALIGAHEIWRWKDDRIQVFKLAAKGRYVQRRAQIDEAAPTKNVPQMGNQAS
jgi:hypothetical protein